MSDADDDEVAIDTDMEPESPDGSAPPDAGDEDDGDDDSFERSGSMATPVLTRTPKGTRPISDKVRAMFKDAAKKIAAQHKDDPDDDDDEVVGGFDEPAYGALDDTKAQPAAPAGQPGATGAAGTTETVAPPAPSMDPQVTALREQWSSKVADLEARESAMLERERASDVTRLRGVYFEKGAPAIVELVKQWTGLEGDELLAEIGDLITDISGQALGVALPREVKAEIESKRAQRAVKSFKEDLAAREKATEERAANVAAHEQRSRVIWALDKEIQKPEHTSQFSYLSAEDNAGELIYEVVDAQLRKDGTQLKWEEAAKRANDYLKTKASAWFDKRKHLLNAAPAPAGGDAKRKTEQSLRETTQGNRRSQPVPPAPAPPAPQPLVKNGKWDPEAHRRQTKQRMRAVFARQSTDE